MPVILYEYSVIYVGLVCVYIHACVCACVRACVSMFICADTNRNSCELNNWIIDILKGFFFWKPLLGSAIWKINFHKSIPLPPWAVHWSTLLPWNWRCDCCLRRTMRFYYGQDAQFILIFRALHKRPNETCYLARPYLEWL